MRGQTDYALRSLISETLICPGIHLQDQMTFPNSTLWLYVEGQPLDSGWKLCKVGWEKQKPKMTSWAGGCDVWTQVGEGRATGDEVGELDSKQPQARASTGLFLWTFLIPVPWEEVMGLSGQRGGQLGLHAALHGSHSSIFSYIGGFRR